MKSITVLMAVYSGDEAEWFDQALNSIYNQTLSPSCVIVVFDGAVDQSIISVAFKYLESFDKIRTLFFSQISNKRGLANALNQGLQFVDTAYIARMDSDDISRLDRFEVQAAVLDSDSGVGAVCSWHQEFSRHGVYQKIKKTPCTHDEIHAAMNYRNVISHPTLLIRTSLLHEVGGYDTSTGFLEDYDLHLRLIKHGVKYFSVQTCLVDVRVSPAQRLRRGGLCYSVNEQIFRFKALLCGRLSFNGFVVGFIVYPIFRISPVFLKRIFYVLVRD